MTGTIGGLTLVTGGRSICFKLKTFFLFVCKDFETFGQRD